MYTIFLFSRCFYVAVQPYGVSGGFYAAAPRERCANLAVRETGVNSTVREDGEHFCEVPEQKFYIRRPNKSEDCGRDRTKEETAAATEAAF